MSEKLNATKHYLHYPKGDFPPYLAYGFRAIFLVLIPYLVFNMLFWILFWSGIIPANFIQNPTEWHIYELFFGVGSAGIMAFLLTGLPELFPGVIPIVGKKLALLVACWLLGRICFLFIDSLNIYIVAIINLIPLCVIALYSYKPVLLDKTQKHASLGYNLLILIGLQIYFFLSKAALVHTDTLEILKLVIGAYMTLILLALRRINTEAVNEWLEARGIDDILIIRPPRYNMAIFCIVLFTCIEFFYPSNSAVGWLAFGASAAILGTLSEYKMNDSFILFEPYVLYLSAIIFTMSMGYALLGFTYFYPNFGSLNHFRHFLTTGSFSLAFFMVLVIVSYIHTGRKLQASWHVTVGVILLIVSTCMRGFIDFFPNHTMTLYSLSAVLWISAFLLYYIKFYPFLLAPRADGIKG